MKLLLDTNAYVAFKKGQPNVVDRIRGAREIIVSTVVMGELLFGFRNGTRFEQNTAEFESFLANPHVSLLPVTAVTADRFGRVATLLRKKGTPIPTNDIWIAAHAMEVGAELLTLDRHFEKVDGLVLPDLL